MDKYTKMIIEVIEYYTISAVTSDELTSTILTLMSLKEYKDKNKKGEENND